MALSVDDPLVWGVVFVVVFFVEVLVVLNMKGKGQVEQYKRPSREAVLAEGESLTDILSRFVDDAHGKRIGETVGMDGDLVIVKESDKVAYLALPRAALRREGEAFRVGGSVDMAEAKKRGEDWRERQHKVVEYRPDELPEDERDRPY